jgi:hypothetical protein
MLEKSKFKHNAMPIVAILDHVFFSQWPALAQIANVTTTQCQQLLYKGTLMMSLLVSLGHEKPKNAKFHFNVVVSQSFVNLNWCANS